MSTKFRKSPPVCLFISLMSLISGKLKISQNYLGKMVKMNDEDKFEVFRNITINPVNDNSENCVFIVSFKFAKLSHKANKIASIIPMLLITGFPGFMTKIYAVNHENGYWQGIYQWKSLDYLEEYKKSLVFRVMNKRAITGTINSYELENKKLSAIIEGGLLE